MRPYGCFSFCSTILQHPNTKAALGHREISIQFRVFFLPLYLNRLFPSCKNGRLILISGQSTYSHPAYLFIMAGVLEQLIRPQNRVVHRDLKAIELEAAKEILAEIFKVRLSEVDEMIRCRFEDEDTGSMGSDDGLWPQEFWI